MKKILFVCFAVFVCFTVQNFAQIPTNTLVQIVKTEDERRYDKTLEDLMKNPNAKIRARAALAAGRIGNETAIPALVGLLKDSSNEVSTTAMFALGEIESPKAAAAVLEVLKALGNDSLRARALEAAGKIAAANPKDASAPELGGAIVSALNAELSRSGLPDYQVITLGETAILRARPASGGEEILIRLLAETDARIRADALNALVRLRSKKASDKARELLQTDADPIVRANAARLLGAGEDKAAVDLLLKSAVSDADSRVRVSAIRSLTNLQDAKAADQLVERGEKLLADYRKSEFANPVEKNELLEIAATLGRILSNAKDERAVKFLNALREAGKYQSVEPEIALARVAPEAYLKSVENLSLDAAKTESFGWLQISALAQGMGELANSTDEAAKKEAARLSYMKLIGFMMPQTAQQKPEFLKALPDVLRSFAAFKTADAPKVLLDHLKHQDLFVRAAAAELIGELPSSDENIQALNRAFDYSLLTDKQYNDAQLAILDALAKQGAAAAARGSLLLALKESDYLVRQKAMQIIRANDLTKTDAALKVQYDETEKNYRSLRPFSDSSRSNLGVLLNTNADYTRAVSRKNARAILTTDKGTFTIEFFPEAAPLTVDNFIRLARANYFNGLAVHRVVPNFVMQDGDPRGDGNGGPGWQIRCELNMLSYERGAVGMALSGKDTGGSQWFVTHSPQPHLDGGYTIFGRVNETDMKIVDTIVRGDKILSVKIVEGKTPQKSKGQKLAR